ncbi:MAG: CopD family protein [Flavobacteriales bacterium]|nr:CopD family protein [Flavobacteriales bacterium]MDB9976802.1 CopD family protein [Flavobacteriaceae bacterium]
MLEYFNYIKSLHIIFVITWFAGLFYIPRLFIYYIEASFKSDPEKKILMDQFIIMMNRLWFIITWPSSILAIIFGLWMIVLVPNWLFENWMIAKLGFVFLLVLYHLKTHFILKELQSGLIKYSSNFMRIWNEITSVILVSVVFLVVLKNNISWFKLTVGLIIFISSLLFIIKLYKRFRN